MVTDIQNPFRDGRDGKDGKDGESAYEIAVRHGFAGNEEEWLESLRGKDGRDGLSVQGPAGEQGAQGLNGRDAYDLSVAAGFHGTREEWLQSLKTLGLNRHQLQHELLENDIGSNMSMQSTFDTDSQNVIAAVNETLATARNGSQSAMVTITALMQSVCVLSARVNMLEAQIKKGGC